MIHIAFIIDTIESPAAGTEKQLLLLLKHLDRRKYNPYLFVLKPSPWLERSFDLCPFFVIGIYSFKQFRAYVQIGKLARFLKDLEISIVQTHFRDAAIAGTVAARIAGIKAVVATRKNQGYWFKRGDLRMQKFLNRWCAVFIANSQSTKQWASAAEGIPGEKIRVIYNGVDMSGYKWISRGMRKNCRSLFAIPQDAPVIGCIANLRPVKGIDIFLKAARRIKEAVPAAKFVIVGDGEERERLLRLAMHLGLNGDVVFTGTRADIIPVLSIFDVGVLASRSESFSNALIEYLAAGVPVVCTDVGGCREAVEDGVNGFVVPQGDDKALAASAALLIKNKELAHKMGLRGPEKALHRFSLERYVRQSEQVYEDLLARNNR